MLTRTLLWFAASSVAALLQGQTQDVPTIRSTTRLVQISVVVHDRDGKPLDNLAPADFSIFDGGRPQKIAVFARQSADPESVPTRALPPNVFTNDPQSNTEAFTGGVPIRAGMTSTESWSRPLEQAIAEANDAGVVIYAADAAGVTDLSAEAETSGGALEREFTRAIRPGSWDRVPATGGGGGINLNRETMHLVSEQTGGKALFGANDLGRYLHRALEHSRISYWIGFYTDQPEDGKFHELKVRVNRPGTEVRHRHGYFAPSRPSESTDAAHEIGDALLAPVDATALAMYAHAKPRRDGEFDVLLQIDPRRLRIRQENGRWVGAVEVLTAQRDVSGKALSSETNTLSLKLTKDNLARVAEKGVLHQFKVRTVPKAANLRIVVRDTATGAVGSLTVPFSAIMSGS